MLICIYYFIDFSIKFGKFSFKKVNKTMAGKFTSTIHIKFLAVAALLLVNLMAAINGQDIGGDDQLQTDQPPAGSPPPELPPVLLPNCNCWNYFTGSRCDNETFWRV